MFRLTRPFNSWDAVKLFAILVMFVDHLGVFFYRGDEHEWLRAIGRGAAPIFLFLGGYAASFRFKWDLAILALMMSVSDFLLAGHLRTQNILVTILLTRLFFQWWDKKGKVITHPYEWVSGSAIWFITMFITQYGIYGFTFGVCAYAKRRPETYPPHVVRNMLLISFVMFGIVTQLVFGFSWRDAIIMSAMLALVCWMLIRMDIKPMNTGFLPEPLVWLGQQIAVYSGYIYALHLIALEWITGIPF